ncbi:putative ubiquitin conjugation factor E4 B [Plasmodium gaboni]|uniref:RING-type E3 ubiquitin transferase n=1 Tax=Plasmodium gaboni TaxID=647221 RepID=A0A151LNP1_9APIC|nr:putative ubiquitin conjugation factor E4 B [Plasmodium gaboni]KYO00853.1 putative ubiquitin conjugation factor E4 B [Plasmodium gaboni]
MVDKIKEDAIIQNIFQICLKKEECNNNKLYLESYVKELNENNEELYFLVDNLYFILLHKISDLHRQKKNCLSYLCSCASRLVDKSLYKGINMNNKESDIIINEISDQIVNSVIIYLENLDIYPNMKISKKERMEVFYEFLKKSCTSRFLKKVLSFIEENDKSEEDENSKQLNKFFNPIIELILNNLNNRSLVYPKNDVAVLFSFLTGFKPIADLIAQNKSMFLYINVKDRMKDNMYSDIKKESDKNLLSTCKSMPVNTSDSSTNNIITNDNNSSNINDAVPQEGNTTTSSNNNINNNINNNVNNNINNNVNNIVNNNLSNNSSNRRSVPYTHFRSTFIQNNYSHFSRDKEISTCGYNFQLNSLLGRLISPTIINMPNIMKKEEIAMYKYFYNTNTNSLNKMTLNTLKNTYTLLRKDTDWILENCVEIIKNLLKSSSDSKKIILLWINCILISNEKKTKIMYHYSTYPQSLDTSYGLFLKLLGENSYGFCLNMFWVLLCLCEPITVNKINDFDFFFFLRNDPFSKFLLKNITNQSSFEDKSNVEKIKKNVERSECFQKEPKFITCIFWMTFKSLSVFFKPAVDEFIKIVQETGNAKDKDFYYMNIHAWKIFLYNTRFNQLLFKFLHLCMNYFLHVAYLYDMNGNINNSMKTCLSEHNNSVVHLVLKCCPPPNEKYYNNSKEGTTEGSSNLVSSMRENEKVDRNEPSEDNKRIENNDRVVENNQMNESARNGSINEDLNRVETEGMNISNETNRTASLDINNNVENTPVMIRPLDGSDDHLYASPHFSIIPTFFLSDIFEILYLLYELDLFKGPNNETLMNYLDIDLFLAFSIFTMLSENHIKSIHLRCESAPKTFSFLYKLDNLKKVIEESDLTKKYIIKSLTNVFIASQKGEYTERMQTRVRIVENFNSFFLNKTYVNQFTQLVINNNNLFVHLIHLLLNDVSFLVEEVVSYLSEIKRREENNKKKKDSQQENEQEANSNSYLNATTRNSRTSNGNNNSVSNMNYSPLNNNNNNNINNNNNNNNNNNFNDSSFNSDNNSDDGDEDGIDNDLSNESMRNLAAKTKMIITYCYKSCIFLNLLCKNYPNNILTSNTILSQIVTCLNCYFDYLVGPKCLNIKVKNMEQYNFRPQLWLTSIVESYLFLLNSDKEHEELLIREIANEGRYYKPEIFNKAYYICKREGLLHKEELNKFKNFCQEIVDMKDEVELFNDVDDIPDNFLDPILQDIMLDPVLLPTSGIIIDRKNIERHLMSEPNDPFNRAPLSKEQLVPMPQLKEEIQNYINKLRQEKKKKKKKNR